MIGVDDGLSAGHLDWADIFFLVGAILAVLVGIGHVVGVSADKAKWLPALLAIAVGFTAFGLFLL